MTPGSKLKEKRILMGLSIKDLSTKTSISESLLENYEEDLVEIKNEDLVKIAKALNVNIAELFNNTSYNSDKNNIDEAFNKIMKISDKRKTNTILFGGAAFSFVAIIELIVSNVILAISQKNFIESSPSQEVINNFNRFILIPKIVFNVVGAFILILGIFLIIIGANRRKKEKQK